MYENSWLLFPSINIQNGLRGSRETRDVKRTQGKKKKSSFFFSQLTCWSTKKGPWNHNYWITRITQLPKTDKTLKIHIYFFYHIFKCIRHKHLNPPRHFITALHPSHDISFMVLHYNYHIKCRTSNLSAEHTSQKGTFTWVEKKDQGLEDRGGALMASSTFQGRGGTPGLWGRFRYLQVHYRWKGGI